MPVASHLEPNVFVSYATGDSEIVLRIVDRLERDGVSLWIDRRRVTGGMVWAQEISEFGRFAETRVLHQSNLASGC